MAVQIPFPLPSSGFALNSKVRVNLDFLVEQFNQFNTGTATWDQVAIGTANNLTGTLTFYNSSNANYLTFQPGVTAANTTFTLPTGVPSANRKFLTSTTAGAMGWSFLSEKASYVGNLVLYADGLGVVQEVAVGSGNKVMVNSSPPSYFDLLGTSNQVVVSVNVGNYTFSLPQSIDTAAAVQFSRVKVDAGTYASPGFYFASNTSNTVGLFAEANGTGLNVRAGASAGSTVFSVDSTGFAVATAELRAPILRATTQLNLTSGAGSMVTIQALGTSFGSYTLTLPPDDGTSGYVLRTDGSGVLTWVSVSAAGGATVALDNLASVAINTSLLPGTTDSIDDGSSSKRWRTIYAATSIDLTKSSSGAGVTLTISNTSNTASSEAQELLVVAGSTASDAYTTYRITGQTSWSQGVDNSDSDKYKISGSSNLGTSDFLTIATTGAVTVPTTGLTSAFLVGGSSEFAVDTSAHRVGVGTASPTVRFQIAGDSACRFSMLSSDASGVEIRMLSSGTTAGYIYTQSSHPLIFTTGNGANAMQIDTSLRVLVGTGSSRTINGTDGSFQIEGTTAATARPTITLNINSAAGAQLMIARSRSASNGGVTILQNNDYIGGFSFMGANGVDMSAQGAYIFASINGTPSSTSMPTRLEFATTPVGSIGASVALTIDAAQKSTFSGVVDMASHKITSLSNGTASTDAAAFGQIKVLQVVSFTTSTRTTTTSSTYGATSLTVTITPSSSSNKVLVMATGSLLTNNGTIAAVASLFRDSTNLNTAGANNYGFGYASSGATTAINTPWSATILDSPATTSAVVYSVKVRNDDNVTTARFGDTGVLQSIVAMEVAP